MNYHIDIDALSYTEFKDLNQYLTYSSLLLLLPPFKNP